ncbi:hypothetical protein BVX98_04920 [bacterium F11]|nr:hypothetical protein BVX98_04920 [bacterium F11]
MDVVTGSFGYIGKSITQELLQRNREVKTITTHPNKPNPFGPRVCAYPYNFENPDQLTATLEGSDVLYNTYWIRFPYRQWSFETALRNTRTLFRCAKKAGIKKIVHISVTHPDESDPLPYYRGKALQERALKEAGITHSIVRPTLVFGKEDILVNNIAWTIRTFPFVPVFGRGDCRVRPIFVGDLAAVAVDSAQAQESRTCDAVGLEEYTYKELLFRIANELERRVSLVPLRPSIGILLGKIISLFVEDILLTKDELRGLMANKLTSSQEPNGHTRFSEWLRENKNHLGLRYTSELKRHYY